MIQLHRVHKNSAFNRGVTTYLYNMGKKMMPKISPTERAALNAGN